MQVVIETPDYLADAKTLGLTEDERRSIVDYVAQNPDAGDEMKGTGGARKIRFAGRGKGKSGGYRVVTFFSGKDIPVFLLSILSKGEKASLSPSERNELKEVLGSIAEAYREGVKLMSKAGSNLIKSARQTLAYARGEITEGFVAHVPEKVDVKAIRLGLGLTQPEFSSRFGFDVRAVQEWEQKRRQPERSARILLQRLSLVNPKQSNGHWPSNK